MCWVKSWEAIPNIPRTSLNRGSTVLSGDFKQRQRGRRRECHKVREKPKGPLRITGGKRVDVLAAFGPDTS